jgi:hypothetical protein
VTDVRLLPPWLWRVTADRQHPDLRHSRPALACGQLVRVGHQARPDEALIMASQVAAAAMTVPPCRPRDSAGLAG